MSNPENDLLLSRSSIWEISIKVGLKKLKLSMGFREWIIRAVGDPGIIILPITIP